ncbi:MAG: response regulator [Acidobacteria bacterium]|nr:response regulator [Acidobacteriota bacterium]
MLGTASIAVKMVVVADDTAFVRDRFRTALQTAGHQASAVADSSQLLAHVRGDSANVDLVVLDLALPPVLGTSLVRALRAIDGFRAPIVVFSGTVATAEEVRELSSLGIAGYINDYSAVQHIVPGLAPHLFPDQHNRRTSPRVLLGISVAYRLGNTIAAAVTLNISRGGIAIRTTSPLDVGTTVKLRFRLPSGTKDIDAEATVTFADRRLGMGLQFGRIDPADQAAIEAFVRSHFFSNRKA